MRRLARLTPGTALGIAAVVLAVSGSAFAAKQYVITSKGQIAPSVRKALKGKPGKVGRTGPQGRQGAVGPAGPTGLTGSRGPEGPQGPLGQDGAVATKTTFYNGPGGIPPSTDNFQAVINAVPGPGKYLAIAKLTITPTGSGEVNCSLLGFQSSIGGYDVSSIRGSATEGSGVEQTITLTYPGEFVAPLAPSFAGFAVYCSTPAATTASFKNAKINLIQTDSVSLSQG